MNSIKTPPRFRYAAAVKSAGCFWEPKHPPETGGSQLNKIRNTDCFPAEMRTTVNKRDRTTALQDKVA